MAVVLFTLGAAFSLFEGYRKLTGPHEVESFGWAIGVLVFAMAAESVALRRAIKEESKAPSGSWWSYIRTTREPENAVVILEDSAAEVGLVAALSGIVMTVITGDARYDALGTLVIAAVLTVVAVVLAMEMRSLLLGESAGAADLDVICGVLDAHPAVDRTVDLRTMHLGPDDVLVAAVSSSGTASRPTRVPPASTTSPKHFRTPSSVACASTSSPTELRGRRRRCSPKTCR